MKKNAWELFNECFKKGDEVVIITYADRMFCGRITDIDDNSFSLMHLYQSTERWEWSEIKFMSHDGFPVKKLFGADGSSLIEEINTENTQKMLRASLQAKILDSCQGGYLVSGDPFMIEFKAAQLFNIGNTDGFWYGDWEESLLLHSGDGAKALVYDIPTIYYAEFNL